MVHFIAIFSGVIFGFGIILSGMVNPSIVLAFLDLAGNWDASLLWVMVGAITIGSMTFAIARRKKSSYLGEPMQIPASTQIDKRLLMGSLLFGIGWGIAGICPGPALVLVGSGSIDAIVFLLAMLVGMGIYEFTATGR